MVSRRTDCVLVVSELPPVPGSALPSLDSPQGRVARVALAVARVQKQLARVVPVLAGVECACALVLRVLLRVEESEVDRYGAMIRTALAVPRVDVERD